jgi:hypothetical protein
MTDTADTEGAERECMGIETPVISPEKTPLSAEGGAESGAPAVPTRPIDPALATLIDAWETLPDVVRAGIVALVNAAQK